MGQICPLVFTHFRTLSPGLENIGTLECISNSFPGTLTYLSFLENSWNSAPMCSFSPIQGTMSWLVLKLHVARIWECNIMILFPKKYKLLDIFYEIITHNNEEPFMTLTNTIIGLSLARTNWQCRSKCQYGSLVWQIDNFHPTVGVHFLFHCFHHPIWTPYWKLHWANHHKHKCGRKGPKGNWFPSSSKNLCKAWIQSYCDQQRWLQRNLWILSWQEYVQQVRNIIIL